MEYLLALVILLGVLARIGASFAAPGRAPRPPIVKSKRTAPPVKKAGRRPRRPARWIESGRNVVVAGRNIGGMIYLGPAPRRDSWELAGNGFINPRLSVSKGGSDYSGESMPYWPSYSDISPRERATYLDWLASGRSDTRIGAGYVFLYFYGLERRFFVDASVEEEKRLLVAEVERLLAIYGDSGSVQRYLTAFLDAAQIVLDPTGDTEPRFERSGYELPLGESDKGTADGSVCGPHVDPEAGGESTAVVFLGIRLRDDGDVATGGAGGDEAGAGAELDPAGEIAEDRGTGSGSPAARSGCPFPRAIRMRRC